MKKFNSIFFVIFLLYCSMAISSDNGFYNNLIDHNNNPSPLLLELLAYTGVQHNGTLQSIVDATQKSTDKGGWLRTIGTERFHLPQDQADEKIIDIITRLGFINSIVSDNTHFKYAIILGSMAADLRYRLAYLEKLYVDKSIRFENIIFLVGQRVRNKDIESDNILLNDTDTNISFKKDWLYTDQNIETETAIAQLIYEQSNLPQEWSQIPVTFVDTPSSLNDKGCVLRPNTSDTVKEWLKSNPQPGSVLLISTQPHLHRQLLNVHTLLPHTFTVEAVGNTCRKTNHAVLLDSLARSLYTLYTDYIKA